MRRFPLLALLAPIGAALACAGPPEEPIVPSPVYELELDGETTFWRYVPLDPGSDDHPSQDDFTRAQAICEGPEMPSCLRGLGFYRAECSDGIDNDGDGRIDHPDDPGCAGPHELEEAPACDDDRDNDGDGLADWDGAGFTHPDPECVDDPSRDREREDRRRRFGVPL